MLLFDQSLQLASVTGTSGALSVCNVSCVHTIREQYNDCNTYRIIQVSTYVHNNTPSVLEQTRYEYVTVKKTVVGRLCAPVVFVQYHYVHCLSHNAND